MGVPKSKQMKGVPFTNPSKMRFWSFLSFPTTYPSAIIIRRTVILPLENAV